MHIPDKLSIRPFLIVAAVFGLTVFILALALKLPGRVSAFPSLQATATPTVPANANACGVVISAEPITPAANITVTVIAEPTASAEVTPTIEITLTGTVSPTGKTLRIGEDIYPAVLDPQRASFVNEFEILSLAYEGLTSVDAAGRISPAAASSYAFTPDQKQLTFTIRDGLKRVDGTPITARDFEAALERALDPCLGSREYASVLFDIQGAQLVSEFDVDTHTQAELQTAMANVGIDAPDEKTLVLSFAEPAGDFWLYVASLPIFYPTDVSLTAESPYGWSELAGNHNGNGPFVILGMDGENSIALAANPDYRLGRPKLDRIEFTYNSDNQALLDQYRDGKLDIDAAVTAELVPQILSDTIASELKQYDAAQTYALAFNNSVAPFTDRIVRTAFSQAVDREGFIRDVLLGHAEPTTRWIPPGVPGNQTGKPGVPASDAAAAVKTLVDNGYGKDGKVDCAKLGEIKFTYPGSPVNTARVQYIADNLTSVLGCEIKVDPVDPTEFTRLTRSVKTNPQLSLQRWVQDYPHPQNWLSTYWTCGSLALNFGYCNVFLDELLKRADSTTDPGAAIRLYQQAEDLLIRDVPGAFLYNPENLHLIKPYVIGPAQNTSPSDAGWIGQFGPVRQYDIADEGTTTAPPAAGVVQETQVIVYQPSAPPDPAYKGSCFTTSIRVQRVGAYRCSSEENVASHGGANLFDPCFVVAGETNILNCNPNPVTSEGGIKLELTAPLPAETPAPPDPASAWIVELENGTFCEFATGATFGVNDMRANFACDDDGWLFGDLKPGTVWTALHATVAGSPPDTKFETEETAPVRRVWR